MHFSRPFVRVQRDLDNRISASRRAVRGRRAVTLAVAALLVGALAAIGVAGLGGQPTSALRARLVDQSTPIVANTAPAVAMIPAGPGGYSIVTLDGGVYSFGSAQFHGAAASYRPVAGIVGAAGTPSGQGYWLVGSDGGIFAFGDAGFFGSMGGHPLNAPIVGMAATPSGQGYWLVAADGGIFAFGDAGFFGSMGGRPLNRPVVGIAPTPSGHGYWMVAADGGIFAFGDAVFMGSMGGHPLNGPVVGMSVGAGGYRMVASDGGIFSFGAPFFGSMGGTPLSAPVRTMATTPSGNGYWMLGWDGAVYSFGDATYAGRTATGSVAGPASGGPMGAIASPNGAWHLAFDDEFAGTALDTSKWSTGWLAPGITPPVNGDELQCYDPAQVSVNNGLNLTLVPRTEVAGNGRVCQFASGMVQTDNKFQFTYGYAEARITLDGVWPGRIANWPAFWTDGQSWPTDGEMDIMEGLDGQACFHFHSPIGGPGGCAPGSFVGTHTYGADWQPGRVDYFYDGRYVGSVTAGVTSAPMYLILNLATSLQNGGPQLAPSTMHVDYVRVWQ